MKLMIILAHRNQSLIRCARDSIRVFLKQWCTCVTSHGFNVKVRQVPCLKTRKFCAIEKMAAIPVGSIDLIHDTRQLHPHFRIDGIRAMSRGISGSKQATKFANTRNRGRVCILS